MRVLQIANNYAINELYKNLFDALEKISVNSLAYAPVKKNWPQCISSEKVIISPCFSTLDRILFFTKQQKMYSDLLSKIDITSFNVIHAHTLFSGGYLAYKLAKNFNIPYIVTVRDTDLNYFWRYAIHLRNIGRSIINNAEHVIFLSPTYRDRFISRCISVDCRESAFKKSYIVPNGINSFWLENIYTKQRKVDSNNIKLIFVGRILAHKGIDCVIDTCRILQQDGYKVHLIVVGKIYEEKYRAIFESCNFIDYVGFHGKEEIIGYMRKADIFVMPSITETFGLVYAEAMSQGLPVIYTRGEGFDRQFEEGIVGYSVRCSNVEDIHSAILKIYDNYGSISRNCILNVKRFNWDKIADTIKDIYEQCI